MPTALGPKLQIIKPKKAQSAIADFSKYVLGRASNPLFSIVLAHRGDGLGLWATIQSCEIELEGSPYEYEYVVVTNGGGELSVDIQNILDFTAKAGKLGYARHFEEPMAPPTARLLATMCTRGKYLFFFDSHCLPGRGYFERALKDMEEYKMDMLHSTTRFYMGNEVCYQYTLHLAENFWGVSEPLPRHQDPYRIAAGGHGGFVVRSDVWEEVGGYWDGFTGYGGEEMTFDLKMAMLDKTNWIDPKVVHHHYAGVRGYSRHYTDDYYRNMMMAANIIGGTAWMEKVYTAFSSNYVKSNNGADFFDLMVQADERSHNEAERMASTRHRTLDEQLELFKQQNIAC